MPVIIPFQNNGQAFEIVEGTNKVPDKYTFEIFLVDKWKYKIGWGELQAGKAANLMVTQAVYIHPGNSNLPSVMSYISPCGCEGHQHSATDFRHRGLMTTTIELLETHLGLYIVPSAVPRGNGSGFIDHRVRTAAAGHPIHDRSNWGYR